MYQLVEIVDTPQQRDARRTVTIKRTASEKLMSAMGKLRIFLGPADRSSTQDEMTEEQKLNQKSAQESATQWEEITTSTGYKYIVPKKTSN